MVSGGRLVGIDVARIFAALAVMLFHLGFWSWSVPNSTPGSMVAGAVRYPEISAATFWGRFGVELFFVVSGFVIAFTAARATPWRFLRSRVLRLLPGALVCASITLAVGIATGWRPTNWLVGAYVNSITFNLFGPWIDGVYWTLGVEICFYAVIMLLLLIGRFRWVEPVIVTLGVISVGYWLWAFASSLRLVHPLTLPLNGRLRDLLFLDYGAQFALGVLLWATFTKGFSLWRCMAMALMAIGGAVEIYMTSAGYLVKVVDPAFRMLPVAIWALAVAGMAAAIALDKLASEALPKRVRATLGFLGMATYPLYLLHDVVGAAMLKFLAVLGVERYLALGTTMLLCVLLACVVTALPEPLVRRFIAYVVDRPAAAVAGISSARLASTTRG